MAEETEDSSQEEALSLEEGGGKVPAMAYGETGFTGLAT